MLCFGNITIPYASEIVGKLGYDLMLGFRFVEVFGVLTDYATRTIYVRHTQAYYNKSKGEEMPLLTVVGPRDGGGAITKLCDFYSSKTAAMSVLTSTFIHPANGWRFVQELQENEKLEAMTRWYGWPPRRLGPPWISGGATIICC